MTIKDIEARTGMTRANIRFYESEGLLSPARSANGYRDYSDHDLEVLKRIKLLRSLRIPLEEIKALHNDSDDLLHTLDRHIAALNAERQGIDRSARVCRRHLSDVGRPEVSGRAGPHCRGGRPVRRRDPSCPVAGTAVLCPHAGSSPVHRPVGQLP